MPLDLNRDPETLRAAALELLEERQEQRERQRMVERAGQNAMLPQHAARARQFPEAVYSWLAYLFSLDMQLRAGMQVHPPARDLAGVQAVRAAREEFQDRYPACRHCAAPNKKFTLHCWNCKGDLGGKAA